MSRKSGKKGSSYCSLPEEIVNASKNVIVKGVEYSSLQHIQQINEPRTFAKLAGRRCPLSSGSDEMLVLPPGVITYYSTESEELEDKYDTEKTTSYDFNELKGIADEMRNNFKQIDLHFNDNNEKENLTTPISKSSEVQSGSLESASENTDSAKTVLGTEYKFPDDEAIAVFSDDLHTNFQLGEEVIPQSVRVLEMQNVVKNRMSQYKLTLDYSSNPTSLELYDETQYKIPPIQNLNEQDMSLTSQIPESSDRGTSPSVMSVSSLASSRPLEWDSAADVGYSRVNVNASSTSLSTLERITLSKCASNILGAEASKYIHHDNRNKKQDRYRLEGRSQSYSDVPNMKKQMLQSDIFRKPKVPYIPPNTSSEEDKSKMSNTSQSPRRKLRKRSTVLNDDKDHHCCSKSNKSNIPKHIDSLKFSSLNELRNDRIKPIIMKQSYRFDQKCSSTDKIESHGVLSEESGSTVMFSAKSNSVDGDNQSVRPSNDHLDQDDANDTAAHELTQYPIDSPTIEKHQSPPSIDEFKECSHTEDTSILKPPADNPEAINEFLKVLSLKLKKHLENLVEKEVGAEAKESVQYNKLMEYINFVGLESTSSEHIKKRQDVAELIVEMCGEVQSRHELRMQDVPIDNQKSPPLNRCVTPVESEGLVAYKPRPSGDLYYMAVPSGSSAMPSHATSSHNVPITQSLPEIVAPRALFKSTHNKQQKIENDKLEAEKESNLHDDTEMKCLASATSLSSLNVDCSCAGGYSASHSSLQSHTSTSDPSEPTSFSNIREQSFKHISGSSCKNMSSFEVERELASIMGQAAPRRVSQMPPVADGRQVRLDSAPNFDSSLNCSLPETQRVTKTEDTSDFPVNLPSALLEGDHYNVGESDLPVSNDEGGVSPEVEDRHAVVCSSSCSESAYETIRSKDRRMDEALASSFEFYCTVSKNARAVGYISSSEQDNDATDAKIKSSSKEAVGVASSFQKGSSSLASSNEVAKRRERSSQSQAVVKIKRSKDSSERVSKKEDANQMKRRQFVKQIKRCANILGKLEENLSVFSVDQRPLESKTGTYNLQDRRKQNKMIEVKTSSGETSCTNTTNSKSNSSKEKSSAISRVVSSPWYGELTQSSYNSSGGLSQMEREVAKLKELQSRVGSAASSHKIIHSQNEQPKFKIVHGDSELQNEESFLSDLDNNYFQNAAYDYGGPNVVNMKIPSTESSGKGSYKTEDSAVVPEIIRPGTEVELPTRMRIVDEKENKPSCVLLGLQSNRVSAFKSIPKGEKSFPPLSSSEFMSENVPLMTSTFRGKRQSFDSEVKTNKMEVSSFAEREPLKADDTPSVKGVTQAPPKMADHRVTREANFDRYGKEERTSVKQSVQNVRDKRVENIGRKKDFGQTYPSPIIPSDKSTAVQTGKSLLESKVESTFKPVVASSKYDSTSSEISNLINKRCGVPLTNINLGDKPILKPRAARAPIDFIISEGQRNLTPPSLSSSSSLFTPHLSKGSRVAEARRQYSTRRVRSTNKENVVPAADTIPVPLIGADDSKALTLQEALRKSRPDFIHKADNRREKIVRHQNIRKEAYQYNAELLTNIPATMHQPDTINKLLYRPVMSPVVPYKEMRQHTKKIMSKLPEVTNVTQKRQREVLANTNRMRQQLYSKKLVSKVVQGKVAHGHDNVCTPSR